MDIRETAAQFAVKEIAPFANPDFAAILGKAGAAGLCRIGTPEEYGGSGGGWPDIISLGRELARHGGNAGTAFSLMYHASVSRFMVQRFGTEAQKSRLLPEMVKGNTTVSFAASEPGVGAHPKHIKASAERDNADFLISGEKTYISNGPVADHYIIIAVTSREGDRKKFTAFLTERHTPGLSLTALDVGWLKSSPHCGLRLDGCRVPEAAILGNPDTAYPDIVLPFRPLEDALMTGLITGGLERTFAAALEKLKASGESSEMNNRAGQLYSILTALDAVSLRSAEVLEIRGLNRELEGLSFRFREMAREFTSLLDSLPGYEEDVFAKDIRKLVDLGRNVSFLKQAKTGETLIRKGLE
jgi:acyl-CoA dehydrogenase